MFEAGVVEKKTSFVFVGEFKQAQANLLCLTFQASSKCNLASTY